MLNSILKKLYSHRNIVSLICILRIIATEYYFYMLFAESNYVLHRYIISISYLYIFSFNIYLDIYNTFRSIYTNTFKNVFQQVIKL